ncbi:hypothetical protein [Telluria beijingensis]|uniref:hypothetical protein n=1 Tax=Telluria beijingensis TaxID=3068633 RepID=UPI0027962E3C|nr:hypothetical protein [Massilia sp. REN29]
MNTIEGNLTLLGNATIQNKLTTYTVVEIGDRILQKIAVPSSLDNFMSRALNQNGTTKLFMQGRLVCGIQTPDGKIYCYNARPVVGAILCLLGVPLIPFFGLGLLVIWQGVGELRNASVTGRLKAMGATPIAF